MISSYIQILITKKSTNNTCQFKDTEHLGNKKLNGGKVFVCSLQGSKSMTRSGLQSGIVKQRVYILWVIYLFLEVVQLMVTYRYPSQLIIVGKYLLCIYVSGVV